MPRTKAIHLVISIITIYFIIIFITTEKPVSLQNQPKTILVWRRPFLGFEEEFTSKYNNLVCQKNSDCNLIVSENFFGPSETQIAQADAIVFHPLWGGAPHYNSRLRKWSEQGKMLIFAQWESPGNDQNRLDLKRFDGLIDATLSYRTDSTFFTPYSALAFAKYKVFKENNAENLPPSQFNIDETYRQKIKTVLEAKQRGVVAVISNCQAKTRAEIVKKLDQLVKLKNEKNIDIYGRCSDEFQPIKSKNRLPEPSRDRTARNDKSFHDFVSKYQFIIAIENSNCTDYITEKVFNNAFVAGTVPIVYGQSKSTYRKLLPESSFLDIADYDSVDKVAEAINFYAENHGQYRKDFFSWLEKKDQQVLLENFSETDDNYGFCAVCQALKSKKQLKKIPSLHAWWYDEGHCERIESSNLWNRFFVKYIKSF